MTILFLTSRIPYPPYRGDRLKIWNLMRQLSKRHTIMLVSFIEHERDREYEKQLREVCHEVHFVLLPKWRSFLNCMLAIWENIPFQVAYYRSRQMAATLNNVLDSVKPDVIHTHLIRMAQYTADKTMYRRVLDMTDAVSLYLARLSSIHHNPFVRWLVSVELKRMVAFESIISRFDRSLVCSENDRQVLLEHVPSAAIGLLYNGLDLETFSVNGKIQAEPYRIIFTGNMSYFPNVDGAKFLALEIFPRVCEKIPNAKLYIVGQDPPASVRALANQNVVVTGFVPDIRQEYLKSKVAVSPIRFGAGTLNKILEPLALGIPVVSTSVGIDGLGLVSGEEILVADEPQEFARAIIGVLSDTSLRNRVAGKASDKVRSRFSWETISVDLESVYDKLPFRGNTV